MSDIAVVGQFAGSLALGSVGSCATLVSLFTGLLIGMGGGINAIAARYMGAGDRENVKRTVHTAFLLSLIYGIVVMSSISNDINLIAGRYDGKKTMHYCLLIFIVGPITCGIATLVGIINFRRVSVQSSDAEE